MLSSKPSRHGIKALIPQPYGNTWTYLFLERRHLFDGETARRMDVPGGRLETEDATLYDGLAREVHQETGLVVVRGGKDEPIQLGRQEIVTETGNPNVTRVTTLAKVALGPITLSDEHLDYTYLPRHEALTLNLDPYMRALLEEERLFTFEGCSAADLSLAAIQKIIQT